MNVPASSLIFEPKITMQVEALHPEAGGKGDLPPLIAKLVIAPNRPRGRLGAYSTWFYLDLPIRFPKIQPNKTSLHLPTF